MYICYEKLLFVYLYNILISDIVFKDVLTLSASDLRYFQDYFFIYIITSKYLK